MFFSIHSLVVVGVSEGLLEFAFSNLLRTLAICSVSFLKNRETGYLKLSSFSCIELLVATLVNVASG